MDISIGEAILIAIALTWASATFYFVRMEVRHDRKDN